MRGASIAEGDGRGEVGTGGGPRGGGLAGAAEEGSGVSGDEEIGGVDFGVAVPAEDGLVRLAVHGRRTSAELAISHVFFSLFLVRLLPLLLPLLLRISSSLNENLSSEESLSLSLSPCKEYENAETGRGRGARCGKKWKCPAFLD